MLPLGVRYFDPSGFFAGLGVTFVRQELDRAQNDELEIGEGTATSRCSTRRSGTGCRSGSASSRFRLNNIFDKSFDYQDDSFRESQDSPSIGPYIPERQVMLYVTLNW